VPAVVGKTRLAIEVAIRLVDAFAAGACWQSSLALSDAVGTTWARQAVGTGSLKSKGATERAPMIRYSHRVILLEKSAAHLNDNVEICYELAFTWSSYRFSS